MFNSLNKLYERKNTGQKLTLRHQLRNVTMNKSETIFNYFMRISQIKDELETNGDLVDNANLVTTLNGFPSSWDPFFQGICVTSKFPKFDKLWTNCTQEESRLISKTQNINDDENQSLSSHVNKRKDRREFSPKRAKIPRYNKDVSKVRC